MKRSFLFLILVSFCTVSALSLNRIIIDSPRDLGGTKMTIPEGQTIVFRGDGCLQNGIVVGNNTTVKAERKVIFKNIILNGTFHSIVAYPEWFDAKADCVLDNNKKVISGTDNINAFRNLFLFDNISIGSGIYMLSGALRCLGGQTVDGCNATLKFTGKGVFMHIDGSSLEPIENVIIRNLTIIGSKTEYTDLTEHWHGVYIGYAKNIKIEDVRCELCRGDGFYIGTALNKTNNNRIPENIELDGVESYYNHRQGLSITRVRVAKVKNSEFCYTLGTMPQAGMDIEPNSITDDSGKLIVGECEDIEISNCLFKGNNREGLILSNWYCTDSSINIINNVKVMGCRFVDDNLYVSGNKDCSFSNLELINSNILVTGKGIVQNVKFTDICIEDDVPGVNVPGSALPRKIFTHTFAPNQNKIIMAKGMNYSDMYAMYQLSNGEKDLIVFCTECGVDYNHFMQWQRKQLWNEKLGKTDEVTEPVISAVTITGRPEVSKKPDAKQINGIKAPISFILIKLSDGMSLRKYNTNPEEISSLLSKLVG